MTIVCDVSGMLFDILIASKLNTQMENWPAGLKPTLSDNYLNKSFHVGLLPFYQVF